MPSCQPPRTSAKVLCALGIAALSLIATAGCDEACGVGSEHTCSCVDDSDCGAGERCAGDDGASTCVSTCAAANPACGAGQTCVDDDLHGALCVAECVVSGCTATQYCSETGCAEISIIPLGGACETNAASMRCETGDCVSTSAGGTTYSVCTASCTGLAAGDTCAGGQGRCDTTATGTELLCRPECASLEECTALNPAYTACSADAGPMLCRF